MEVRRSPSGPAWVTTTASTPSTTTTTAQRRPRRPRRRRRPRAADHDDDQDQGHGQTDTDQPRSDSRRVTLAPAPTQTTQWSAPTDPRQGDELPGGLREASGPLGRYVSARGRSYLATIVPLLLATVVSWPRRSPTRPLHPQGWTASDRVLARLLLRPAGAVPARQPRQRPVVLCRRWWGAAADHPVLTGSVMAWVGGLVPDGSFLDPDPLVLRNVGHCWAPHSRWPSSTSSPPRVRCTPRTPRSSRSAPCCCSPRLLSPRHLRGLRWPRPASGPGAGADPSLAGAFLGLGCDRAHLPAADPAGAGRPGDADRPTAGGPPDPLLGRCRGRCRGARAVRRRRTRTPSWSPTKSWWEGAQTDSARRG